MFKPSLMGNGCFHQTVKLIFVSDPPQLWLRLGQNLAEDQIKVCRNIENTHLQGYAFLLQEGDDVYFTCDVSANPDTGPITWKHDVSIPT